MPMTALFHDSDFLAYLVFETAELVRQRCVRGGRKILPAKKIHLLRARVVTFYGLYGLTGFAEGA
jgi:hypothetical protein